MTALPGWMEKCRHTPITSNLHDRWRLVTSLAIAWEILERFHKSGYEDATDAMRRIEKLGEE